MEPLGIVIATRWEAGEILRRFRFRRRERRLYGAVIGGRTILLAISGVGRSAARQAADRLCEYGAGNLISMGFCGALVPELRIGDLVTDRIATTASPARDRAERQALTRRANAIACDMETQAVIEAGTRRGVPIHILRVVSDGLEDDLTPLFGSDPDFSSWRIAARLLNPKTWPLAWRLRRHSRLAKAGLADALADFLKDPLLPRSAGEGVQVSAASLVFCSLLVSFWLLYGLTLRRDYTYDGLCYALDVELAPVANLFHPNHLLYSAVSYEAWRLFQWFGYQARALFFMQSLNALMGALAVAALGGFISRRLNAALGLLAGGFFGLGYSFWSEATDPGCYAWAGLAACLLLALLLESDKAGAFWVGAGHGILVLFHQMLILAAPGFCLRVWRREERPWAAMIRYLSGLIVTVGLPYGIVAAVFHGPSWRDAAYWALGPAGPPPGVAILSRFWWSLDFLPNVSAAWTGWVHSLVAAGSWQTVPFAMGSFLMAAGLIAWIGWAVSRRRRVSWDEIGPLLLWVIVFNGFLFFFYPGSPRYRILFWPPLLYLGALALTKAPPARVLSIGTVLLAGLFVFNSQLGIRPLRQASPQAARVAWVRQQVRAPDFLLFAGKGPHSVQNVFMAYFAPLTPVRSLYGYLFSHPTGDFAPLERYVELAARRKGRFFVDGDLLDPHVQRALEAERGTPAGAIARWLAAYRIEEERTGPDGYRLVRLRPRKPARAVRKFFQVR